MSLLNCESYQGGRVSRDADTEFVTSERSERSSYWQSCMGLLDIQIAVKPLQKIEIHFYNHFSTC